MKKEQIAINTVSLTIDDLEAALGAIRESGFLKVEFALRQVKEYFKAGGSTENLRRVLDRLGLRCIGGFECILACFAKEEQRERNHVLLRENAGLLANLGARNMVIGIDRPDSAQLEMAHINVIAETLKTVADDIAGTGVSLLIEFNWGSINTKSQKD